MEFALDDEQSLLVTTIRRWSERALRGWAADADRRGAAPDALWGAASELGLLLDAVPSSAGGLLDDGEVAAYSHLARALRGLELGRGCAALAALVESNVEPALAVLRWGSPAARESLFGAIGAVASPGGAPRIAITAHDFYERLAIEPNGSALTVRGRMGPLPGMALASHVLVAARIGDAARTAEPAAGEPVLALVPVAAGRVAPCEPAPSGWRAAAWGALELDGAAIAPELVLARGDEARRAVDEVLSWYRVGLAARAVGAATAAIEHAGAYGQDRIQFGRPIGRFESLARMRDENQTAIAAARLLVLGAAWEIDRGLASAADSASRARDLAAQVVTRATIDAVQIFGGYGFVNDFPVEKLMRDARPFEVLGGNEALARVLAAVADS
ncbi:MAG TPA: acyl-CoA dehydrogenase family protein [Kofleriaceae bacterium]|nr:acyl-CoA dehydrogenase family protein [Kofleriaceae bacterium]